MYAVYAVQFGFLVHSLFLIAVTMANQSDDSEEEEIATGREEQPQSEQTDCASQHPGGMRGVLVVPPC